MPSRQRSRPTSRRRKPTPPTTDDGAARLIQVEVGPYAHGGHCVARHEGRVVFVRHALPGETVEARVTEGGTRFWRADAVRILANPSPDRVPPAWPEAGPGGVGGGELSHVSLDGQLRWKRAVIAEQFSRLAKISLDETMPGWTVVHPQTPTDDEGGGLHYRTRIDLVTDATGRAGMRRFRSHEIVPLTTMPLATEAVLDLAEAEAVFASTWEPGASLRLVASAWSEPVLLVNGLPWRRGRQDLRVNARKSVVERAGGFEYRVSASGFWQVHQAAPDTLIRAVMDLTGNLDGARVLDLYAGAGLFTLPLAATASRTGSVIAIEGDDGAVGDLRRNVHDLPTVTIESGDVATVLRRESERVRGGVPADLVVLDPPRTGAGRDVVDLVAERRPQRIVYVACDPAALARDTAYLAERGYVLAALRAFDLFPMTHHVECVAAFAPG